MGGGGGRGGGVGLMEVDEAFKWRSGVWSGVQLVLDRIALVMRAFSMRGSGFGHGVLGRLGGVYAGQTRGNLQLTLLVV